MRNVAKPCPGCPWMATAQPGALGGSPPQTYIGQAFAPFLLPCHNHCNFEDPDWKSKVDKTPQCAGAAMFRQRNQIPLPAQIYKAEPEGPLLATPEAFYAHHMQITEEDAKKMLEENSVFELSLWQLSRQTNKTFSTKE